MPVTVNDASVPAPASRSFVPASMFTPNVAFVSSTVNLVAVALSVIPVDVKLL